MYRRLVRLLALAVLPVAFMFGPRAAAGDRWNRPGESFVNWEDAHVHPLDLTPDGKTLLAVNTPGNSLLVFAVTSGTPALQATIPVGVSPVSVRVRGNTEAWVVNRVSNSVTVVDLTKGAVSAVYQTETEPADVVFAGTPQRAFVTCAKTSTVDVFDPANPAAAKQSVFLYGKEPRALAVSADGAQVYAAFFLSGNATTAVTGGKANGQEVDLVARPEGPYAGVDVPPNRGKQFVPPQNPANPPPPRVSMIVRKNAAGKWLDDNNGDWSRFVSGDLSTLGGVGGRVAGWDMPDRDVAVINTSSLAVTYQTRLMNSLMAMAVRPGTGEVTVVGTDATNEVRWEPNLQSTFLRVDFARFKPGGESTISDLNPHLNYSVRTVPPATRALSVGDPRGIVWSPDGSLAYVTGMGSNNVVVMNGSGARVGQVNVGQGPTGIVYQNSTGRVFVLNKFDASISVLNAAQMTETARVSYFDPTPAAIKVGRPFLYDTHLTSGLGQVSCASCHIDGRTDGLAWDLGDPSGTMTTMNGVDDISLKPVTVQQHPMKGPMLTSTLEDKMNNPSLHFSGDRAELGIFASAFQALQGADAALATDSVNKMEDFLATIHVPPNPFRNLDNTYSTTVPYIGPDNQTYFTGDANAGAREFESSCRTCHPGNSARGDKIRQGGGFGIGPNQQRRAPTWRNFQYRMGLWFGSKTGSTQGFGYQQDGTFDSTQNQTRSANMYAFMFSVNGRFPYAPPGLDETNESRDTHAAVGQQLFFNGASTASQDANLTLFTQLADRSEVGLIAKATVGGVARGYAYLGNGTFQSDRRSEQLTTAQVRALAGGVLTVVPRGSETRLGIDRDLDGVYDGDAAGAATVPIVRSQTNVASRGTATQSSDYSPWFSAASAIDGNAASFSHTASADAAPWWQDTLDDTYAIDRVTLVNRDGFGSRLRDISVYLLDAEGNVVYRSHFLNRGNRLASPSTLTVDLIGDTGAPVRAKTVKVLRTADTFSRGQSIPGNSPDEQHALTLCEVQIYGAASDGDAFVVGATPRVLPGGTFEEISAGGTYVDKPTGTPWTYAGQAGITCNGSWLTANTAPAPGGTQVLYLINVASVTQTVKLLAGTYTINFMAAQGGLYPCQQSIVVSVDGKQIGSFLPPGTGYTSFQTPTFTVPKGYHTIQLSCTGKNPDGSTPAGTFAFVDSVQIAGASSAPVVGDIAAQINGRGSRPSLQVAATDPNGSALTYTATGLPAGLSINATTGLISGTVSGTAAGFNPVQVLVSNGSVTTTKAFNWAACGNGTGVGQDGITIDVDDAYTLYVNGVQIGQVSSWNQAQRFGLDLAPGDVLAVDAVNVGGPGGAVAHLQVDGTVSGTNAQWKAASTVGAGWTLPSFQDSGWANATDIAAFGNGPWGNYVTGLPANTPAHWICGASLGDAHFYLRYTIPAGASGTPKGALAAGNRLTRAKAKSFVEEQASAATTRGSKSTDDLPGVWSEHLVGGGVASGGASFENGAYTLSGADAANGRDGCEFVWQELAGDGELTARLKGDATAAMQAGLMMRATLHANASFAFVGLADGGWSFRSRAQTGGETLAQTEDRAESAETWVRLVRRGDVFSGYRSADGKTWAEVGTARILMDHVVRVGMAVPGKFGPPVTFDQVRLRGSNLPDPWKGIDIGQTGAIELDRHREGTFRLHGSGIGLGSTADQVRFVKQGVTGDTRLQARVTPGPDAVGGLMFREGQAPEARHVSLSVTASGEVSLQWRATVGATAQSLPLAGAATGSWLRLERTHGVFNAYRSADGVNWTLGGTVSLPLEDALDAGLGVSGRETAVATKLPWARFDGVGVTSADSGKGFTETNP